MEPSRSQRFGKPYYRTNFAPPNTRQALEDRLHPPGVSTSSNSSWTFSNSHCDVPKPRKGRLCGIFLIGAVLVVALAVIAIAGLAFYIGGYTTERHVSEYQTKDPVDAKRQYSTMQTETTRKPTTRPTTSEKPAELSTQPKPIPEGAIFGISQTMQHLNGLKNKRKEDPTTTQAPEDFTTDQPDQLPVTDIHLVPQTTTHTPEPPPEGPPAVHNGHARPLGSPPPPRDYSDEPWRPIIPPYRGTIRLPHQEPEDRVLEHRHGPPAAGNDSPITFSRESYEQNLKTSPEYSGEKFQEGTRSRISEEIAAKYKELVRGQATGGAVGVASGEVVTAPPGKPSDVVVVSDEGSSSTLTTYFNATEGGSRRPGYPLGVDQMLSGISLIESRVESTTVGEQAEEEGPKTTERKPTTEQVTTEKTTEKTSVRATTAKTTTTTSTERTTTSKATAETATAATSAPVSNLSTTATVRNPFLDDSRASSSNFNFGLPELPILKQFHHLDSLLKSFSKADGGQFSKYFVRSDDSNETTVTRFPARTKQTTVKSYKKDDTVFVEVSTISAEPPGRAPAASRRPVVVKGEVEVVAGPVQPSRPPATTEVPKLITLLPVRSNVNMLRPLRPRPKSNLNSSITVSSRRQSKMSGGFGEREGKRWAPGGGGSPQGEELLRVTPQPGGGEGAEGDAAFVGSLTRLPLYNTIETLLNSEQREKGVGGLGGEGSGGGNTSEIVERIVRIVGNVAIATGESPEVIVRVNESVVNGTTPEDRPPDAAAAGMSTKAISSHYKLNQAGVPVLTKVLTKADSEPPNPDPTAPPGDCGPDAVRCGNGSCLPPPKRCDQFIDCPDAADERNCSCAEHLKAQRLHRKLCDGVVDCWDFSDEFNCEWCQQEFLCSNSRVCIRKEEICDGTNDCPFGDDERNCVTVSPSRTEAEAFGYHHNGYLMVRKNGRWGKLCVDNFESVSLRSRTGWKIADLGRTVCRALTFRDFEKVERTVSVPNEGRSVGGGEGERYYELGLNEVSGGEESRGSVLSFQETGCSRREVVKVTCTELECGVRPQATGQWSRIVGGGNAGPGAWPWQAALYREGEFQCGATLISENWLISAGHCFYHNQDAYWVARLGALRTTLLLPSPYEQLRQISKILLHPQYVDSGFINDISLLRMRDPVRFTDYVRPICLPKQDAAVVDGRMCTVVGWGQLSEVGWVFPDTLQEVQLPILSSDECRKRTVFLPLYKITDDMFCAGYERGGRDACLGDSGGPLMCQEADGKWSLMGVTSNGYGCARSNRPGVYTRVSRYLGWIQAQMALHSEPVVAAEGEEQSEASSSRNLTEPQESGGDAVVQLISQRVSNVKLSSDSGRGRDRCGGHRCPLGECLPKSKLCNGHIECSDGSDEKDCW